MKLNNSITPEVFFKNKDYFDHKLIVLLETQQKKLNKSMKEANIRQAIIYKNKAIIQTLKLKNKDLTIINENLKQCIKETKEDSYKIIKEMDKEIRNINKKIEDELQKSYEENNRLYDELERIKKENERLKRENEQWMKTAKTDSSNSSYPPSTDLFKKPVNLREPSTKKRGGQPGHKVHHSKRKENPDKIIEKTVSKAPTGATPVLSETNKVLYYVTQEIDAKLITIVTETRYYINKEAEKLSDEIMNTYKINSVTYANSFKSSVLYLNSKGTIPLHRLCRMLNEWSGEEIDLKPGTVVKWSKEFYEKSQKAREDIVEEVLKSPVIHVDETGWKIRGKNAWMQVLCTATATYILCTEKRSDKEDGPLKLLEEYEGYLIHDHFKPYYQLLDCIHAECNAHILRYLKAGVDFYGNLGCVKLIQLFREMNNHKKKLISEGIAQMKEAEIKEYEERYLAIINETVTNYYEENPNMARKYVPTYIKTMERLKVYKEEHLRFIVDFNVDFDNNAAERQARAVKTKKKVSGQSNTIMTANYYAAIHTINQTCILQNKNTLQTIEDILNGKDVFSFFCKYSKQQA